MFILLFGAGIQVDRCFSSCDDTGIQDLSMLLFCHQVGPWCQLHPSVVEGETSGKRSVGLEMARLLPSHILIGENLSLWL